MSNKQAKNRSKSKKPAPGRAPKKTHKTGEALRKAAIADADRNIKAIEAAERAPAKGAKPKKAQKHTGRTRALDAACEVLADAAKPMHCRGIIEAMAKRGLWTSPKGKTPHATLSSAIQREIAKHGAAARFKKGHERGTFTITAFMGKAA